MLLVGSSTEHMLKDQGHNSQGQVV